MDNERHRIVYRCLECHYGVTIITAQPEPPPLYCIKHGEKCDDCGGSGQKECKGWGDGSFMDCAPCPQYINKKCDLTCPTCSGTGVAPLSKRWPIMEIYSHIDLIREERVI